MILLVIALAAVPPAVTASERRQRRAALARCPGGRYALSNAAHIDWGRAGSTIDSHVKIRTKLGATLPSPEHSILLRMAAGHHTTSTSSILAKRQADGDWEVDIVRYTDSGIIAVEERQFAPEMRVITGSNAKRIDAIIAHRCLVIGPTFWLGEAELTRGVWHDLEVRRPTGSFALQWIGIRTGIEQELASILLGQAGN